MDDRRVKNAGCAPRVLLKDGGDCQCRWYIMPGRFIIPSCAAIIPRLTRSLTSAACVCRAETVSASLDVCTTTIPFAVASMVVRILSLLRKMLTMLRYRPNVLDRVRAVLAEYRPEAGRLFDEARRRGFTYGSLSFVQFAEHEAKSNVSRQVARTIQEKARKEGLDLDIPLQAYDAVFNMRHVIDMNAEDRHALAVALEKKDWTAAGKLMERSRAATKKSADKLDAVFGQMLISATCQQRRSAAPARLIRVTSSPALAPSGSGTCMIGAGTTRIIDWPEIQTEPKWRDKNSISALHRMYPNATDPPNQAAVCSLGDSSDGAWWMLNCGLA